MRRSRFGLRKDSLGWRVLAGVLIGELVFSLVLGITIGAYSVRAAAQQRQAALVQLAGVVAAGLMPIVADQQEPQVLAQMQSIMQSSNVQDVESIRIVDSAGSEIAAGDLGADPSGPTDTGLLALLSLPQVLEQPVVVDGLEVARVYVEFAPVGVAGALRTPLLAAAIVVLSVALVSIPWTAWLFVGNVVEPLDDLRASAAKIAAGDLTVQPDLSRRDEIGELQRSLAQMAAQLRDREAELHRSYDELADANAALGHANQELERMARLKADFVAVASHELRTPLATIRLYADMLESGEICALDERGLDAAAAIGSAATRLSSIVADLMDSALLERGMLALEYGDVWVDELVTQAVADADVLGRARGVAVRLSGEPSDSVIRGDAARLRQVLDNLISNAVKYSDGADLVTVSVVDDGELLHIEVADQGRGIAESEDPRLFTFFGRLDSKDNRDTAGLGLGLAISARVVEAHGGTITHRPNTGGRGSVFAVHLPADPATELEGEGYVSVVGREPVDE